MKPSHLLIFLLGLGSLACNQKPKYPSALSPEESMKTFSLAEGFDVRLFASEPKVKSPVAMAVDEAGEVYVVEMGDYPHQADSANPKGCIRWISDTNSDGLVDTSLVFADGLPSATSILPWNQGLLVAAAPNIWFLKDTTNDHRADVREKLFNGFFDKNSEAQITNLTYGIDNWIYANNNGQAGEVRFLRKPDEPPVSVQGGAFRFRVEKGLFEAEAGNGQFGLAQDSWGNQFFTQNTLHIQHSPIAGRYLERNPFASLPRSSINISDHELEMFQKSETPYWRQERSRRRQQQFDSLGMNRKEWARDHFTGASGGTYHQGEVFPKGYEESIFTGEVAGNLIHRDMIRRAKDGTFVAERAPNEKASEFLTSTDTWFRPASFYSGPDGALYVIDMYRQHIETPVSIPDDLKKEMDFEAGKQMGRIYRISSKNAPPQSVFSDISKKSSAELVSILADANAWHRFCAQRLLIERNDKSVIPVLRGIIGENAPIPITLHSLYTLEGLGALNEALVGKVLDNNAEEIQRYALVLAEQFPGLRTQVLDKLKGQNLSLQAVLSAGNFEGAATLKALAKIATANANNPLLQTAVLTAPHSLSSEFLIQLKQMGFFQKLDQPHQDFLQKIYTAKALRNEPGEVENSLRFLKTLPDDQQAFFIGGALSGASMGLARSKAPKDATGLTQIVEIFSGTLPDSAKPALEEFKKALGPK